MLWFKHHSTFRNSPQIKLINRWLGAEGVVAVYRLYEVMTEHFGACVKNQAVLELTPPYTDLWLADELQILEDDPYGGVDYPCPKKLRKFLGHFEQAGIIELAIEKVPGQKLQEDGSRHDLKEFELITITLLNFSGQVDEYTQKKLRKGVGTPDAIRS